MTILSKGVSVSVWHKLISCVSISHSDYSQVVYASMYVDYPPVENIFTMHGILESDRLLESAMVLMVLILQW